MKQLVCGLAIVIALAACSSAASKAKPKPATPAACTMTTPAPQVSKVAGVAHDYTLTSFDGARIRFHWFPIGKQAPVVLMGPGWGESGAQETGGSGLFGDSPVKSLEEAGYNVLTWDPRGFGKSTGTITIDAPEAEARDVSLLISWTATQPNVIKDGPQDPRVGMVGGSYGGGIQFVVAATDCRVDAIVPTIAWHSLTTSLAKADTPKNGWADLLYAAAPEKNLDPHIVSAHTQANTTGVIDAANRAWFAARGPGDALMNKIRVPTLIIQGTVDTLFTLDEAVSNYNIFHNNNVPVAMLWFCGGHGVCLTKSDAESRRTDATMKWLQRWLMRDTSVDTGPAISIIDQNAKVYTASTYPLPPGEPLTADGKGDLKLQAAGGSGPATIAPGAGGVLGTVVGSITPARASNAVNVSIKTPAAVLALGAPTLELTYSGTSPASPKPTRVFAQLVDDKTGLVIGNQITPIKVTLDGKSHTATTPLEMISFATTPRASLTLQLVATTGAYAVPALGGKVNFSAIHIEVPTVSGGLQAAGV